MKRLLAGDGSRRRALEQMVLDEELSNHVFFLGYRDDMKRHTP